VVPDRGLGEDAEVRGQDRLAELRRAGEGARRVDLAVGEDDHVRTLQPGAQLQLALVAGLEVEQVGAAGGGDLGLQGREVVEGLAGDRDAEVAAAAPGSSRPARTRTSTPL
jgi:hypothetical protein